jgi:hypothetical protein
MQTVRHILALLSLLATTPAVAAEACSRADVAPLLADLDRAQINFDAATLERVFDEQAEISAIQPGHTLQRGRAEFIAAHRQSPAGHEMLAYVFEQPAITCGADGKIEARRRGCQVSKESIGLMEVSQTEQLELRPSKGRLRIVQMASTLDALRVDGKERFGHDAFVELKECADAVGRQN